MTVDTRELFVGSYVYYVNEELQQGAEYGLSTSAATFVDEMRQDILRMHPAAYGYRGTAWRMSKEGMQIIARRYVQRYWEAEYGQQAGC